MVGVPTATTLNDLLPNVLFSCAMLKGYYLGAVDQESVDALTEG